MSATEAPAERFYAPANYSALGFVMRHLSRYEAIWARLGWEWRSMPHAAARAVNEILGAEHSVLNPSFDLHPEQRSAILEQLFDMGWFNGLALEPGTYDDLLLMGAKFRAMVVRAKTLVARLSAAAKPSEAVTFQRIFGLFGQRPRTDALDGTVAEIYGRLTDEVKANPWVEEQMALMERPDAYDEWHGAFATEFELGILSIVVATNGEVESGVYMPIQGDETLPGVPPRTIESYTLTLSNGSEIVAINAPAVERPGRTPRPTSHSTIQYWMEHYEVESGSKVVIVTVRVHGRRIVGDAERLIHSINPGVTVLGYTDRVGEPELFFNHALTETVNQLMNAVLESLNGFLPTWVEPVGLPQLRAYLDELYELPDVRTFAEILGKALRT